jgi:two-component system sensor histidine kinase GlrK
MRTLPLLPRNFVTALLAAFVVVLLPLAAALTLAVLQMHELAERSRMESHLATDVGAHSAAARESLPAIERHLRQAQILGAVALREAYQAQADRLLRATAALTIGIDSGPQLEQSVRNAQARIAKALAATDPEAALRAFDALELAALNAIDAAQQARAAAQAQLARLPQQASGLLFWLAAAAVPLAVVLALAFSWQLGRPIRQLGEAMRRLGEGDLSTPVSLRGPVDIVRLADRLEWLRARLVRLENARSLFLRSMSHDLKTPLAAIAEGASSLDEQLYGNLTRRQRSVVALIRHNAVKLRARIDALLCGDLAAGAPPSASIGAPPAPVDLGALLRTVVDEHRLALARRRLRIEVSSGSFAALGDAVALRVAIDNLVSNAVKFSFTGGRVELTRKAHGERAVLRVCNDGPGLIPGEETRVFTPGMRGSAAAVSGAPGSGHGLAIAREIAQSHGGRLWAEPSRGGSTCFVMELPLLSARQKTDAPA